MVANASLINPGVILTTDRWGVTLTSDPGSFHARLVFEGVKEVNYAPHHFYRVAHLCGPSGSNIVEGCFLGKTYKGIVQIQRKKAAAVFQTNFSKKTQTWVVARDKIERLIKEIKKEVGKETPFNICGNKSIFSKPSEVIEIYNPLLAEIKKCDPNLFLHLFDSAQNGGECTGMNREAFDGAIATVQRSINAPNQLGYSQLIELVSRFTVKVCKYQDNCFTWCRDNLERIDIKMCDTKLEQFISITTLYATHRPEERLPECQVLTLTHENGNVEVRQGMNS